MSMLRGRFAAATRRRTTTSYRSRACTPRKLGARRGGAGALGKSAARRRCAAHLKIRGGATARSSGTARPSLETTTLARSSPIRRCAPGVPRRAGGARATASRNPRSWLSCTRRAGGTSRAGARTPERHARRKLEAANLAATQTVELTAPALASRQQQPHHCRPALHDPDVLPTLPQQGAGARDRAFGRAQPASPSMAAQATCTSGAAQRCRRRLRGVVHKRGDWG